MKRFGLSLALLVALGSLPARAAIVIDAVPVGDAGNAGQVQSQGTFGAVAYDYRIGAYEVTNDQYVAFLNAVAAADAFGLYHASMGSDVRGGIARSGVSGGYTYAAKANMGNKPVNYVDFWDAARFANWLHNKQPTGVQGNGTTETGAYTLGNVTIPSNSVTRNSAAAWFIPSEDEWYKAAYYNPATASYFAYPTSSDAAPAVAESAATGDVNNPGANVANYLSGADWNGQNGNVTTVGSAGATSPYGAYDQGGNVYEWTEGRSFASRIVRGGAWGESSVGLQSSVRTSVGPTFESNFLGFRVASSFLAADFDEDRDVDSADLNRWKLGFGLSGDATHSQGDANGDRDIDGADLLDWQRQLGSHSGLTTATNPIPEPSAIVAMAANVMFFSLNRRHLRQTAPPPRTPPPPRADTRS